LCCCSLWWWYTVWKTKNVVKSRSQSHGLISLVCYFVIELDNFQIRDMVGSWFDHFFRTVWSSLVFRTFWKFIACQIILCCIFLLIFYYLYSEILYWRLNNRLQSPLNCRMNSNNFTSESECVAFNQRLFTIVMCVWSILCPQAILFAALN